MPINPFINLFGTGAAGGLGTAGGAAGGAAAGASIPWAIILPIALSFLQSSGLFGETESQRQDKLYQELMNLLKPEMQYSKYWRGQAKGFNPVVMEALLNQLRRSGNWGWPEGMGMDLSFLGQPGAGFPGALGGQVRRRY